MKKVIILMMCMAFGTVTFSENKVEITEKDGVISTPAGDIKIPELPKASTEDELNQGWQLEKNYTAALESKLNVFVPLEILSDIDINAVVIDNEILKIPFDVELNKKPEKENYYKLKFTETEIDIDEDGQVDTRIFTPKFINQRIVKENYVEINGKNITKDGDYQRKIYITIEVGDDN